MSDVTQILERLGQGDGSDQFHHRLMPVHDKMGAAGKIGDSRFAYIDA